MVWDVKGIRLGCFRTKDNYEHTHPHRGSLGRLVGASLGKAVKCKEGKSLTRHGGAPRGWRHLSQMGVWGHQPPSKNKNRMQFQATIDLRKFFSNHPLTPARNFSIAIRLIGRTTHAGEDKK